MVSGLGNKDYSERLIDLKMNSLSERREELDMTEMFKIMSGQSDVQCGTWFEKVDTEGRVTRQSSEELNVRVPGARLDLRKHFFSVRVCEKWNSLPSTIKHCRTAKNFKTAYRQFKRCTQP